MASPRYPSAGAAISMGIENKSTAVVNKVQIRTNTDPNSGSKLLKTTTVMSAPDSGPPTTARSDQKAPCLKLKSSKKIPQYWTGRKVSASRPNAVERPARHQRVNSWAKALPGAKPLNLSSSAHSEPRSPRTTSPSFRSELSKAKNPAALTRVAAKPRASVRGPALSTTTKSKVPPCCATSAINSTTSP